MRRVFFSFLFLILNVYAFAAEHGAEGAVHHPEISIKMELFRIINFVIFLFLLYKFAGRAVANMFSSRQKAIEASIEEAKRSREEAEKRFSEAKAKVEKADDEIKALLERAEKEREEQIKRIKQETEVMLSRIKEQAKAASELEVKKAKAELQREAVNLAVEMAEDLLKRKVTEKDQKFLIEDYITKIKEVN